MIGNRMAPTTGKKTLSFHRNALVLAGIAALVSLFATLLLPTDSHAADAPGMDAKLLKQFQNGSSSATASDSTAGKPKKNGQHPTYYRPLRTAPSFRHPPGFGAAPLAGTSDTIPTPLRKPIPPGYYPYPPGFGDHRQYGLEDITSLDELDAIGQRLVSVALDAPQAARDSLHQIRLRRDRALIPPLVHAMQFSTLPEAEIAHTLSLLAGENPGDTWFAWAQWLEAHPDLVMSPSLARAVLSMWRRIDGKYLSLLPPERSTAVPKASIYWDGSRVDAVPVAHHPRAVSPNRAFTLQPADQVLGVTVNGETRAYPLLQLLGTPVINDELGGHAITVAYEPLCGFPVAIDRGSAAQPNMGEMGWAGLVYRSSRLLYTEDNDHDLWDTCTGLAITGDPARPRKALPLAFATVTSWSAWRSAQLATTVLDSAQAPPATRDSAKRIDRYLASSKLAYPVHLGDTVLPAKERMLLIGLPDADHAVRLGDLSGKAVINDRLGDTSVVIVVEDPLTCSIRVYARPENEIFAPSEFVDRIYGSGGGIWKATETALISPAGEELQRVPARGLFWFSIDGLHPITDNKPRQSASTKP